MRSGRRRNQLSARGFSSRPACRKGREALSSLPPSLAQALAQQGQHGDALAALRQGFERVEATGEKVWEVELHRVKGLVLLAQGQNEEGQASLEQAIAIARQQQAKSLELRSAMSLARLWGERGRRAEAVDLLAPVYGWFTEGFDTADLKQAKALLDDLA